MRLTILTLALMIMFQNLFAQDQTKKYNPIERNLKVWNETEKDYKRFIRKQARVRKKLDKHIEPKDFDQIQILKSEYQKRNQKREEIEKIMPEGIDEKKKEMFLEVWTKMIDRFNHQIRSHEIMTPMLGTNKNLYEIAEYLSIKYDKQIEPIKKRIGKLYQKLKKKERKVYLKYYQDPSKKRKTSNSNSKKLSPEVSDRLNVFSSAKILIIESKK